MFKEIDIAGINNGIALSVEGVEFEIRYTEISSHLLVATILEQLKISTIKYRFGVYNNELLLLKEVNSNLELRDDTIRFHFSKKNILNLNDILLFSNFLNITNLSKTSCHFLLKWGKKNEIFFDFDNTQKSIGDHITWGENLLKTLDEDKHDIQEKRFKVLLNSPFLDKLKTYFLFWTQKYGIGDELPDWYQQLY